MARHNVVADTWEGQLNFRRLCTYVWPQDRCWLVEDLTAWNSVLRGFSYELVEVCPGKLSIQYMPYNVEPVLTANARLERDFLVSWLLEHHRCIDELRVLCTDSTPEQREEQVNKCLSVRCLEVTVSRACTHVCYLPAYICALRGVEELRLRTRNYINESVLLGMLRCNSNSLRFVEVLESQVSRRVMRALQRLDNCESLKILVRPGGFGIDMTRASMTRLLRLSARAISLDRNVSIVADCVKTNLTLTTLDLGNFVNINAIEELSAALAVNATLRTLRIGFIHINASCGEALALAVSKNASLLDLELAGHVLDVCMINMARALSQNTTLEKLLFTGAVQGADGVLALCDALHANKTLKKVVLPAFSASHAQRAALAEKLAFGGGYRRVLMPLAEPDVPPLLTLLASPTSCPEELGQISTDDISVAAIQLLFDTLASNSCVKTLSIAINANSEANIGALCTMLRANRSISTVKINLLHDSVQEECFQDLLNALNDNKIISELQIISLKLETQSASSMSHFLARNRTITQFRLSLIRLGLGWVIETLYQGIIMNPIILEFQVDDYSTDGRTRHLISEVLRKNKSALNRAVDFVVLRCEHRQCAEAFELFSGKAHLLAQVTETSGQTEREAQLAIVSAGSFLADNYLFITGIVRRSIVCHPGHGRTQCDQLNADCWRAIVRHLKISDVI